jgi:opacity protein-like surface antigen
MKVLTGTVLSVAMLASVSGAAMNSGDWLRDNEVNVGIGFGNFSGDLGSLTSTGVSWLARAGVNPSPYWGLELNYQGIQTSVGTIIPATGSPITGQGIATNELTADFKGGYPIPIPGTSHTLKPYGFAGIGWAGVNSNAVLTHVGLQASDAAAFPLGAGAEYRFTDVFSADTRFTWNFLTGSRSTLAPSGDSWDLVFSLGAHFGAPQ